MDAGGPVTAEVRLRPGPLWRIYTLGMLVFWVAMGTVNDVFDDDPLLLALVVAVGLLSVSQQFTSVSVGADGITRRRFLRRSWGWEEITGIGWTSSGSPTWKFRTERGTWKPVTPWTPLRVNSTRDADRQFIDALVSAATDAGLTYGVIPPWPRGEPTSGLV